MKSGGAFALGLAAAAILLYAAVFIAHLAYPLPPGLNARDSAAMAAYMAGAPVAALLIFLAGWFVAALGGVFIARHAGGRISAWSLGALLLVAAIGNLLRVPQPLWLGIADIAAILIATLLAGTLWRGGAQ